MKKKPDNKSCPLCDAVSHNDKIQFHSLIQSGAEVNGVDKCGYSPLSWAALEGRCEMAKILIDKGANLEFKDPYGNTPLLQAVLSFSINGREMIDVLLAAGADPNAENKNGFSPAHFAKILDIQLSGH